MSIQISLMNQRWETLAWYTNNFVLANPEKFQSLSINPRNVDAANSDRALNIDNHEIETKLLTLQVILVTCQLELAKK